MAIALLVLLLVALPPVAVAAPAADCGDLNAQRLASARAVDDAPKRPITSGDLLHLRDLDTPALSPDGRYVAIRVHQAHLPSNGYCTEWWLVPTESGRPVIHFDDGGEPLWTILENGEPNGSWEPLQARWSPDGQRVAYLKTVDGRAELWAASIDAARPRRLSRQDGDIDRVAWSADGANLIFRAGPSHAGIKRTLDAEGDSGYLYDERVIPRVRPRPFIAPTDERYGAHRWLVHELASGHERGATDDEIAWAQGHGAVAAPGEGRMATLNDRRDAVAWRATLPGGPTGWWAPTALHARRTQDAAVLDCPGDACVGRFQEMFWSPDASSLYFIRREGVGGGDRGLYVWNPDAGGPRRILRTPNLLSQCATSGDILVCILETPTSPAVLVSVDAETGTLRTLVDPNPELAAIRMPKIERLVIPSDFGPPVLAHLISPLEDDDAPDPLVVTPYNGRGFQRGATGDEYPLLVMAASGLRVLNFSIPMLSATNHLEHEAIHEAHFREAFLWRATLHVLGGAIDDLVARGLVDPCRTGIGGLSNGANITHYGILHSDRFAAAIASTPSWEPARYYAKPVVPERLRRWGYEYPGGESSIWPQISIARNTHRMSTPLLWNLADAEYLYALEAHTALREARKPVEMYVYPDEQHVKMHPRHRLAIYDRNVDWYRFWLQDYVADDPGKREQYARWERLRGLQSEGEGPARCGRADPGRQAG